jgi:hypothetical protein
MGDCLVMLSGLTGPDYVLLSLLNYARARVNGEFPKNHMQ